MLEILDGGIGLEDSIPNKEDEVQDGKELDCPEMYYVLDVLEQPEA